MLFPIWTRIFRNLRLKVQTKPRRKRKPKVFTIRMSLKANRKKRTATAEDFCRRILDVSTRTPKAITTVLFSLTAPFRKITKLLRKPRALAAEIFPGLMRIAKQNDDHDETEDISDIFSRNSAENSYIDDIKTGEIKKSNNIFSQSVTDTDFDALASTQFGDDYSEADYPYADTSDSAADAIEAELSPLKEEKNNFIRYHEGDEVQKAGAAAQAEIESSSVPGNEYQNVLTEMIDKFDSNGSEITKNDIANNALELNDRVSVRAFGNIVDSARELGEEIVVRTNDNSAKHQYSVKYYYNDSLLRLVICGFYSELCLSNRS